MNFRKALLVLFAAFSSMTTSAQTENQACEELKFSAMQAMKNSRYKLVVTKLNKAERVCGSLDEENWGRLIECLQNIINFEQDETTKSLYVDSILSAFQRQEAAGFYDENLDLIHGVYNMQLVKPDLTSANFYFQRGIKSQGKDVHESFLIYAYYTSYLLYDEAHGEEKSALRQRMFNDYLRYSEIADRAEMSFMTKETFATYMGYIFPSCEELLPKVESFIDSIPKENSIAISMIRAIAQLIEDKRCDDSEEYLLLIDVWSKLDSNSMIAFLKNQRAGTLEYQYDNPPPPPAPSAKQASPEEKAKRQYQKALFQWKDGQWREAYATGKECSGEYRQEGLIIAAKSVAGLANSCGETTFERKCNYIYAAQLAEEAGNLELANRLRSKGPTTDCSSENDTQPVYLSCWDVTINVCP